MRCASFLAFLLLVSLVHVDVHEYLEHPAGSGAWYYRDRSTNEWVRWVR
jgi:hypothetical protein